MFSFVKFLLKLLISLKCLWNEYLDKLKCSSVKICAAKNWNPRTNSYTLPCTKYAIRNYCKLHSIQLADACAHYHYIRDLPLNHPMLHVWAHQELNERIEFCQRFSKNTDYGHEKWHQHLQGIIDRHASNEKFKRERQQERLDYVLEGGINSNEIKECPMLLFYMGNYEYNNIVANDDWSDRLNSSQLHKRNRNLYLFNNYYSRNSLSELNYLNLVKPKRKPIKIYDDEW